VSTQPIRHVKRTWLIWLYVLLVAILVVGLSWA
jgi:hypothetical protein